MLRDLHGRRRRGLEERRMAVKEEVREEELDVRLEGFTVSRRQLYNVRG